MDGSEIENQNNEIQQKLAALSLTDTNSVEECKIQKNQTQKCIEWLETVSEQGDSECSCSNCSTTSTEDLSFLDENLFSINNNKLMTSLESYSNSGKYKNIAITNCKGVHVGPNYQFNAPVNVIKNILAINSCDNSESDADEKRQKENKYNESVHIISRRSWLAQPPLEPHTLLEAPAKYVIICHTATEEGFSVSENTYIIRLIQDFHIFGRKWNDIGYNFLVGSDGKIYEGRGFNVVGAHTYRHNVDSFGIAFVGCFINNVPPVRALTEAQKLIALGVSIGAIAKNYSLVAHCQLSPTVSPGGKLYEEVKKWDNWDSSEQYFEKVS